MIIEELLEQFESGNEVALVIGPDAIFNRDGKSLSQLYREKISIIFSELDLPDTIFMENYRGVIEATIIAREYAKNRDVEEKFLERIHKFWATELDPEDFPSLIKLAQISFSTIHYFGFDNLLHRALVLNRDNVIQVNIESRTSDRSELRCAITSPFDGERKICVFGSPPNELGAKRNSNFYAVTDVLMSIESSIPNNKGTVALINWYGKFEQKVRTYHPWFSAKTLYRHVKSIGQACEMTENSVLRGLFNVTNGFYTRSHLLLGLGLSYSHYSNVLFHLTDVQGGPPILGDLIQVNETKLFDSQLSSMFVKKYLSLDSLKTSSNSEFDQEFKLEYDAKFASSNEGERKKFQKYFCKSDDKRMYFISYATEQSGIAEIICTELASHGIPAYFSHKDKSRTHQHWWTKAQGYIRADSNSLGSILLVSDEYLDGARQGAIRKECDKIENAKIENTDYKIFTWCINKLDNPLRQNIGEKPKGFEYIDGTFVPIYSDCDDSVHEQVRKFIELNKDNLL